jgi:glycosyltransferase involved in cell wall biosynthesis
MAVDFSVVVPTFRRVDQLRESIASVIAQPGVTTEIFVIDDSAEGSAQQVVERFTDARISYVKNPLPTGGRPSVVRNLGWPLATGSFVHLLDDDDIVVEGHYAAVKSAFEAQPGVGLLWPDRTLWFRTGDAIGPRMPRLCRRRPQGRSVCALWRPLGVYRDDVVRYGAAGLQRFNRPARLRGGAAGI